MPTVALAKPLHDTATHIWGKGCLERDQYESCIVTDVRFENEAAICDRLIVVKRNGVEPVNAHKSEVFATYFQENSGLHNGIPYVVIENNGTLDDLKETVKKYIDTI